MLSQKFLVGRSQLTTIVICGVIALPAAFVAVTVKVYVPGIVGFPVRSPLRSSDNPVGSEPDLTPNVGAGKPSALKRYATGVLTLTAAAGVSCRKVGACAAYTDGSQVHAR